MTTQALHLTDEQVGLIRQMLAKGGYNDASQVVDEALHLLVAKQEEEQAELEWLRAEVQKGLDAFEQGDFVELDSEEAIQALSADVRRRGRERLAPT